MCCHAFTIFWFLRFHVCVISPLSGVINYIFLHFHVGLWLSHKRKSWMPHITSFNDDSWVLHGKAKCAMKTYEIRRNYKEWTSSSRKEDSDGWDMCCAWKRQDTKASHTMANGLMHQKSRKAEIELDWHCISRFEVNWHGMGRCRASSSRQRRLVWMCGPMCLWHGLN